MKSEGGRWNAEKTAASLAAVLFDGVQPHHLSPTAGYGRSGAGLDDRFESRDASAGDAPGSGFLPGHLVVTAFFNDLAALIGFRSLEFLDLHLVVCGVLELGDANRR